MSSWTNLKDAGRMLPAWFGPFMLSAAIIGLYVIARFAVAERPHELVSTITQSAIVLALLVGFAILVVAIAKAKAGNVVAAIGEGFNRGLTYVWVTSAVCLGAYVCAGPAYRLLTVNIYYTVSAFGAAALLVVGYFASGIRPRTAPSADHLTGAASTAMALPVGFTPSIEQRPAFQITIADQNRLMVHQAARIIAYKGSNCLIADTFSAHLDVNARTAKIFTDLNLLSTADMIYWRMHMLLIGTAAEQLILDSTSEAALDDMQNFDDLALRYLQLTNKGNFFRPVSDAEAMLKANRLSLLRTSVGQRCSSAVARNKDLIIELVRLMRGRPSLLYLDLRHIIDRVEMPADFPRAEFDSSEAMERVLLQLTSEAKGDIEGQTAELEQDDGDGVTPSNVRPISSAATAPRA